MRVVLAALRSEGKSFDQAWAIAIQRIRIHQGDPLAEDLAEWKEAIRWAQPVFQAAYTGLASGPERMLADLEPLAA